MSVEVVPALHVHVVFETTSRRTVLTAEQVAVTARSAPAHDRVIATLKSWGVRVNDAFFLGGIGKQGVLSILKPHIFFDDQLRHLESTASVVPSVHVPFGVRNAH